MKAIFALCLLLSVTAIAADDRLKVSLLYEFLCPGCQAAITGSFGPALPKGLLQMVDLQLIPYGNASEYQNGSKWSFQCQHGQDECYGNTIENCILAHINDDEKKLSAVVRMEHHAGNGLSADQALENTASELNFDHNEIRTCARGDEGNRLQHAAAVRTPSHSWVPWVLLDGQHANDEDAIVSDIFRWACENYNGANQKPAGCNTTYHVTPKSYMSVMDN